jgi:hypothetical protein
VHNSGAATEFLKPRHAFGAQLGIRRRPASDASGRLPFTVSFFYVQHSHYSFYVCPRK